MRLNALPAAGRAGQPTCFMADRFGLGIPLGFILPGAQAFGTVIVRTAGFRRYLFKARISASVPAVASSVTVFVNLIGFDGATVWQQLAFGPSPFAIAHRIFCSWGEGTGVAECEMGPYTQVGFENHGPDTMQFNEAELWGQ